MGSALLRKTNRGDLLADAKVASASAQADIELWRARLLEEGAVLILFPEDTRSCCSTHAAWPPERHPPRPGRLHLIIGPTLRFAR